MTTLFIANCTKQNWQFLFNVPENKTQRMLNIPMGSQIQMGKEYSSEALRSIIEQYQAYGMTNVSDIDQTKTFIGLCYSYDKPVPVEKIMRAHENNEEILVVRGQNMRKDAVGALSEQMDAEIDGQGIVNDLEVTITEMGESATNYGKMQETLTVDKNASSGSRKERPRRRMN